MVFAQKTSLKDLKVCCEVLMLRVTEEGCRRNLMKASRVEVRSLLDI